MSCLVPLIRRDTAPESDQGKAPGFPVEPLRKVQPMSPTSVNFHYDITSELEMPNRIFFANSDV